MALLLGNMRIMMLTTHYTLQEACRSVTKERVQAMPGVDETSLRAFGVPNPKIAVAVLNPHAGVGGLSGREELDGSIPAVKEAVARGIKAVGPIPADVVPLKARDSEYDLVLAMYHDQASMAAKHLGHMQQPLWIIDRHCPDRLDWHPRVV